MFMPTSYGDTTGEYWAIVKGVSLWDVAAERQVEIIGPDALALTQLLTPRDIDKCPINRARYVVFVDENAGIINDAVLYRHAENHFWLSPGDGDVLLWAKGVAAQSGLDVVVREPYRGHSPHVWRTSCLVIWRWNWATTTSVIPRYKVSR
jgi:aminomethyltransferase